MAEQTTAGTGREELEQNLARRELDDVFIDQETPRSNRLPLRDRGRDDEVRDSQRPPNRDGSPSRIASSDSAAAWASLISTPGPPSAFRPRSDLAPSLPPSSSSRTSSPSAASKTSKRSRSPVKNEGDLRFVNVEMRTFNQGLPDSCSSEFKELLNDIVAATRGLAVIPAAIQGQVSSGLDITEQVWPYNVDDHYHLSEADAVAELNELRQIVEQAAECELEHQSEAAWNARVHDQLLRRSLRGTRTKPWIM